MATSKKKTKIRKKTTKIRRRKNEDKKKKNEDKKKMSIFLKVEVEVMLTVKVKN